MAPGSGKRFITLACIVVTVLLVFACGGRPQGHGVLLWSPQEDLVETGSMVPVYEESTINNTYTIGIPDSKERMEIDAWRLRYFRKKREASEYASTYQKYKNQIAIVAKDGLPIRKEPSSDSPRVYKLREKQKIKILDRQESLSNEGGIEDYWYRVLTGDGAQGFCFGYSLRITRIGADETVLQEEPELDATAKQVLSTVWRPEYYKGMINDGRIDLSRFTAYYGLFPDLEEKTIELVNEEHSLEFDYSEIVEIDSNRLLFEDTSLRIRIINRSKIEVEYETGQESYSEVFVTLDKDVREVIEEERVRRENLYSILTEGGQTLSSSAYGSIELNKDKTFSWYRYQTLVPDIIPPEAETRGKISFNLFLSEELQKKYEGAVSFSFDGTPKDHSIAFLFTQESGGIRFVYVPKDDIEDGVIKKENPFPIVIFFTAGE
jgi:hypothetical protein